MPRRRIDIALEAIDYKNPDILKRFITESGKILPRRMTGMPAHFHRKITREIKKSRQVLLMASAAASPTFACTTTRAARRCRAT